MSNARVLYINLTGVTCEMMKNLVLAGVAAAVCDNRPYPAAVREVPSSFLKAADMERIIDGSSSSNDGNDEKEPETKKAKTTMTSVGEAISPKVEELNPLLIGRNSIENRPLSSLPEEYFGQFDAVVASRLSVPEVERISSAISRYHDSQKEKHESNRDENYQNNTLFIVTDTFGLDGCAHLDFGASHKYIRELGKDKLSDPTEITPYVSMGDMLAVPLKEATGRWDKVPPRILVLHRLLMDYWSSTEYSSYTESGNGDEDKEKETFVTYARGWMDTHEIPSTSLELDDQPMPLEHLAGIALHPEVCPVAAVLGGVLGNEVIKSLTRKGEPSNNVLMFSGLDGGCRIFTLRPTK